MEIAEHEKTDAKLQQTTKMADRANTAMNIAPISLLVISIHPDCKLSYKINPDKSQ